MNKPKYLIIKNDIEKKILEGIYPMDSKIPSELKLSTKYKVSRHTVRQAISELVTDGYLSKVHGSGTYVSNLLINNSEKKNKTIGVITTYLSNYIFPSIIRGIEKELRNRDYSLLLASTHNNVNSEKEILENMLNHDVDGLIIEPTKSNLLNTNLNYYLNILEKKIPLLMLNATYEELDIPYIALDDRKSSEIATKHLIDKGHKDIAMITKTDDLQGKYRLEGYVQALKDEKMNYKNDYLLLFDTETEMNISKKIKEVLLSKSRPTAIVCYNDQIAIKVIEEIKSIGLNVPDDVSIVSHDNSFLSTSIPGTKLTSIEHPKEGLGKEAANWIITAVENKDYEKKSIIFPPKLIIRDSTKDLN